MQGKIRYYACSNWTTTRMKEADAYAASKGYRGFVANEALYNIGEPWMKPMADDTLVIMDEEMQKYHEENPRNLAMPYSAACNGFFINCLPMAEVQFQDLNITQRAT